jgi:tetratricopeptide (TPR) repeat protein
VFSDRAKSRAALWGGIAVLLMAVAVGSYWMLRSSNRLPSPESPTYEEVVRSFYLGLANLEVGLLDDARRGFARAGELVPGEPATWANLGLVEIRLGEFDAALPLVQRAASLAPESGEVELLFGQLETSRGRLDEGVAHFRRAVELDPGNLRARAALAQEIERAAGPNADGEAQRLYEELLALRPDNLAVLLERARLAAKRADLALLQDTVGRLGTYRSSWPALAVEQYGVLERAARAGNFADAARAVVVLRNVLVRLPAFRESLLEIRTPAELIAEPFTRFLKLQPPSARPSPPDEALTFSREPLGAAAATRPMAMVAFSPNGTDAPVVFAADGRGVRRIDAPGSDLSLQGDRAAAGSWHGLLALDWSRDFKTDLALVGSTGLKLLVQSGDGEFTDVTPQAARNGAAVTADSLGVWTADIEMDGDLDLVVGVKDAPPVVLRNNGDGTWRRVQPFPEVIGVRAFVWGDLDRDGDPDAALVDARSDLRVFANRQGGAFRPMPLPADVRNVIALALGDINADGVLDLVTLDSNGSVRRMSAARGEGARTLGGGTNSSTWNQQQLATWSVRESAAQETHRLFLADLDNSGTIDLVASGAGRSQVWLASERGDLRALAGVPEGEILGATDLNGDGQLDLLGLVDGRPVRLMGRGTKGYHWQVFRTRAQQTAGDQRINSFGVGGDIEVRSGLLTQKQPVTDTLVHFGLGTRTSVDVARIVWPNGVVQAEFGRRADEVVVAEQRLKGSCPWVFTYDGRGMRFVTDFLWRSPLGLRINAQDTAGVTQTEDWVKIRGDQLVPKDGKYDVRITAELWETHFVDHLSLMVVDHPRDTEVFVDERFSKDAPILAVHAMTMPKSVRHARDDAGRDVTDLVASQDGRYLATFDRGAYQGIARDHFVEIELGDRLPAGRPQWLIANGWIYPTDSSINVAIGQGREVRPQGLSLEAQTESGRWVVVDPDLGFPAGKNKTILIDLGRVTRAGVRSARRLRLLTNLEVYWDWLAVADGLEESQLKTVRLQPERGDLQFRGFSETTATRRGEPRLASNRDGPEVPIYDKMANVTPRWRDLIGYYTRFGDVRELLQQVDDRYVIMNAGDELQLLFPALPPPAAGWKRDFVLTGDGWEKDGDYSTSFSATVLPLPSHDRPNYDTDAATLELEDDAVYRRHPGDWQTYHTRFVSPDVFLDGLRQRR